MLIRSRRHSRSRALQCTLKEGGGQTDTEMARPNMPSVALDQRVLEERLRREVSVMLAQPTKENVEASAAADDLARLRKARNRLSQHSNGYHWKIEREECKSYSPGKGICATASLAQGVSTAEADFMCPPRVGIRHRASATRGPTMPPARFGDFDPSVFSDEEYMLFMAKCEPLKPPAPVPEPRSMPVYSPARLADNNYAGTLNAQKWLDGERSLSQWDTTTRSEHVAKIELESKARARQEAHDACKKLIGWEKRRLGKQYPLKPKEPIEGSRPGNPLRVPR